MRGVRHADAVQVLAHVAARRQHLLALLVREPDVPLDEALHGVAQATAGELGEVRVIEADQWNAATARHAGRRPGGMKGIADFDEIRFERLDGARPAARIERQPVVECTGHGASRDHRHIVWRVHRALTGNHETVAPVGVRPHPLMLGEQVTLHPTAGGRVEQRGVDDVHGERVSGRCSGPTYRSRLGSRCRPTPTSRAAP